MKKVYGVCFYNFSPKKYKKIEKVLQGVNRSTFLFLFLKKRNIHAYMDDRGQTNILYTCMCTERSASASEHRT